MQNLLLGHWEGSKKKSWWSHCQSKGKIIAQLFIPFILTMVSHIFASPIVVYALQSEFYFLFSDFQESQLPDPSDLFTNVYVKGLGVEVIIISSLLIILSYISIKIHDVTWT